MKEEEEEYDLHHENEVTSEDLQAFEDISTNSSEIRDPDTPMTKQMVVQAEEMLNNLFNGDTGDFEEGEEYNPTEEEKKELENLFEELENPQPAPPPPSISGRVRKLANKEWGECPTLDSLEGAEKYQPDYFQNLGKRKPLKERRMKSEMMTLTLDDEVVKGKKYVKGETTTEGHTMLPQDTKTKGRCQGDGSGSGCEMLPDLCPRHKILLYIYIVYDYQQQNHYPNLLTTLPSSSTSVLSTTFSKVQALLLAKATERLLQKCSFFQTS